MNIPVKEAAEKLGITPQALSNIMTGSKPIGRKTANRFADTFGFSTTYLLTGEGRLLPDESEDRSPDIDTIKEMAATIRSQQETIRQQLEMIREAAGWQKANIEKLLSLNKRDNRE